MILFLPRNVFDTLQRFKFFFQISFYLSLPPSATSAPSFIIYPAIFLVWITSGGAADYLIQIQIFHSIRHPKPPAGLAEKYLVVLQTNSYLSYQLLHLDTGGALEPDSRGRRRTGTGSQNIPSQ